VRIEGGPRPFLVGRYEVTNAEYAAFVRATGYDGSDDPSSKPTEPFLSHFSGGAPPPGLERHPVCHVNLMHARAYCRWLSGVTGRRVRLPRDAEWERAARGREGRTYPWGDEWDPRRCNWGDALGTERFGVVDGFAESAPVGSFPSGATPEGVHDLAGNIWEWTEDGSLRGGPWCLEPGAMKSEARAAEDVHRADDKFGFRILVEVDS
jgi:formylglycine-generating enzyme required for sulfatase activity